MLSILIVASIAVSVAIGYKTKFNTGLFAMVFAYLIGCFGLGMSAKDVINGWPVSTMYVIFAVSLFYNFAMVNSGKDRRRTSLRLPPLSGSASLCPLSGGGPDCGLGSRVLHGDGFHGSPRPADLR